MTQPALRFWLDHVAADGGLWEPSGDRVLVVLPPGLGERYRMPEEVLVTDDPDVARSDGVAFLGTGHPVLAQAADAVLAGGDAGVLTLARPSGGPPAPALLQERAREQIVVAHGRIDLVAPPQPAVHWLLRVGALVDYTLSSDEHVAEQIERWVHVADRREVPAAVVTRLVGCALDPGAAPEPVPEPDLARALAEADAGIEVEALRRRAELAGEMGGARDAEIHRTEAYYAEAIAGLRRRVSDAPPDRRALLEARLSATADERTRRLAEIAEKYLAQHAVTPYRLHAIAVPALRLTVDIRRGERRYPAQLDWLAPVGVFAQPRCPGCDAVAPLVAGKSALGCLLCLTPKAPAQRQPPRSPVNAAPAPRPAPVPPPRAADPPKPPSVQKPAAPPKPPAAPKPAGLTAAKADNLAAKFWNAVATGENRRLRGLLAPGAPAAVLHALYGMDGFRWAVRMPEDEGLVSFTTHSIPGPGARATTEGILRTSRNASCHYVLHWWPTAGGPALAEVARFRTADNGRCWCPGQPPPPAPRSADAVTARLLRVATRRHGLPLAARAAAAWARLVEADPALWREEDSVVLAAAVHRLVAARAGQQGVFREFAEEYGVSEELLRRTDAAVRKKLALGPDRAW